MAKPSGRQRAKRASKAARRRLAEKDARRPTILVIGDWFVDENWLIARQDLYHSSAPGDVHYIAKHTGVGKRIISLCGAAALVEMLRTYRASPRGPIFGRKYRIAACGVWNPMDCAVLKCTLCPEHAEKKLLTPYTVTSLQAQETGTRRCYYNRRVICKYDSVHFVNLADPRDMDVPTVPRWGSRDQQLQEALREVSTNRIVRCFEGYGGGMPHQLYRIDWELALTDAQRRADGSEHPKKHIHADRLDRLHNVAAVVIEDHGLGVITKDTVEKLLALAAKQDPRPRWFVRTKIDSPDWLPVLLEAKVTLDLVVADFKLARHRKGERRWWRGTALSRAALELLGEMTNSTVYEHTKPKDPRTADALSAAVLLDDNTLLGMYGGPVKVDPVSREVHGGAECFCIGQAPGRRQPINLNRTTVFFASLVAQELARKSRNAGRFAEECRTALQCAYEWSKEATAKWAEEELYLGDYRGALSPRRVRLSAAGQPIRHDYHGLWQEWIRSSTELGLVSEDGRDTLKLWMGEGTLRGYICVGGPKRDQINRLASAIAGFNRQRILRRPFGCLLISSPGWGKSFLAKCLAQHFDMEYLEFSVSQMAESRDLIECLATVASVQSRSDKRVLVFVDEMNAPIEGHSAMNLLLGPLWDGVFVKDGKSYRLSPAAWVFASTSTVEELGDDSKGSDFISRLNGPIIQLDSAGSDHLARAIGTVRRMLLSKEVDIYMIPDYLNFKDAKDDVLKTEQVYLMVSLLNTHWGPISRVQKDVLQMFHDLLPVNGVRSLEFFALCFEGIRRGEVLASNVPRVETRSELRRHVLLPQEWLCPEDRPKDAHEGLVEIKTKED